MKRTWARLAMLLVTLGAAMSLPGCEGISFLGNAIAPEKIKARYDLVDRPTLVLVDDPYNLMGNPGLTSVIASLAAHELVQNDALAEANLVDPQNLANLQAKLGSEYARTPVDKIGRELGAQQVIHVNIESARIEQVAPETFKPTATARVKVIDAATGNRLFPQPDTGATMDSGLVEPGLPVTVTMTQQIQNTQNDRGYVAVMARAVAERLGQGVGRVFFNHLPRQPGEKR